MRLQVPCIDSKFYSCPPEIQMKYIIRSPKYHNCTDNDITTTFSKPSHHIICHRIQLAKNNSIQGKSNTHKTTILHSTEVLCHATSHSDLITGRRITNENSIPAIGQSQQALHQLWCGVELMLSQSFVFILLKIITVFAHEHSSWHIYQIVLPNVSILMTYQHL